MTDEGELNSLFYYGMVVPTLSKFLRPIPHFWPFGCNPFLQMAHIVIQVGAVSLQRQLVYS